jgi:23S rRNA (cytosine1962-C5)-methyltransferase
VLSEEEANVADVVLKPGREKPIRNHHPWVFSGAVQRVTGSVEDGDVVTVRDVRGRFLGHGYLNRRSQIIVRLLSWDPNETVDDALWERRILDAIARRAPLAQAPLTTAYRLIYAEADRLPGLIVDRYGDCGDLVARALPDRDL